MKRKKDWRKRLNELKIPWEEQEGNIYLWGHGKMILDECLIVGYRPYTEREVWNVIKDVENGRPYKKDLKNYHHRKNRRATKQYLHHGKDIPSRGFVKEEDPWSWD